MSNIIEVKNLTFKYPQSNRQALNDISFNVKQGAWVAIIGHNGSGKSTLAKLLNYLLIANEGTIKVADMLVNEANMWQIREKIGMVFQNPENQFVGATVEDDVAFGMENRNIKREEMQVRVQQALMAVNMQTFAQHEPSSLSGGQKQRVAIAGVLAIEPQVLILDEATSMLDPQGRQEIIELVQKLKKERGDDLTVISITHDIDEAALADKIIIINDGQLIETGQPTEIFAHGDRLLNLGLDVPFAQQVKGALQKAGIKTPTHYLDEKGLLDWLWELNSNQ
ncbi:energy-coupling factor ABC transporter ATP-binding protein [Periweissella beninensis]|uniref:energy-coupling factor ABC transporter ATP-binding protein n=1 Tax=Periweissella beninensis TaxID=504936 RepID=UPI0021A3C135|nr:energy-coupling factor ABC transporter ATP-binding protein [Periweissella beninensis]MCT4395942.1 energy-coupling factor ABC transporter ATP-binding protein [Periweissella beninensis]